MRTIQPFDVWYNGRLMTISKISVVSVYDDLKSYAKFYYQLYNVAVTEPFVETSIAEGNVLMEGNDYVAWDNSNESAYQYVADKLNITLLPLV